MVTIRGRQGVDALLHHSRPGTQVTDCYLPVTDFGRRKKKKKESFPLEIVLQGIKEYSLKTEVALMAAPLRIMLGREMAYQYSLCFFRADN